MIRTIRLNNLDVSRHEKREDLRTEFLENNSRMVYGRGWTGSGGGPLDPEYFKNVAGWQENEKTILSKAGELAQEDFVGLNAEELKKEVWEPHSPTKLFTEAEEVRTQVIRLLEQVKERDGTSKDQDPNPNSVRLKKGGFFASFLTKLDGSRRGVPTKFYTADYGKTAKLEWLRTVGNHNSWYAKDQKTGDEYFHVRKAGMEGRTWVYSGDKETLTYNDDGILAHPLAKTPELGLIRE